MAGLATERAGFAREALRVMEKHGDIAAEACWQELSQVIMQYWVVFQGEQSPLSTWNMVSKCTENVLKIRALAKAGRGDSGAEALEAFRAMMGEVLEGDEGRERSG